MIPIINAIPAELRALRQWVFWRYEERGGGKPTKVPYTAMGYPASATNPEHWSRFDYLVELLNQRPDFASGISFVFSATDPYCGIDIDDCYPSDAAECAPWGGQLLDRFADTYQEQSPSGKGVKIWCRAKAPRCGQWPVFSGRIEVYDSRRQFTFTGQSNGILDIADHQADIEALVAYLDHDTRTRPVPSVVIPARIRRGCRHNTLVSLAGSMWRRGMSLESIEAALLVTNRLQCDPPYPDSHIRQIIRSMAGWQR
jgi:primase-polymerase (primpol)-like protein